MHQFTKRVFQTKKKKSKEMATSSCSPIILECIHFALIAIPRNPVYCNVCIEFMKVLLDGSAKQRRWAKTSRENFPKLIMRCWRIFLAVKIHQAKTRRSQRQITSELANVNSKRGKNGEVIKKIGGGVKIRRKAGAISTGGASGQSPQEIHP